MVPTVFRVGKRGSMCRTCWEHARHIEEAIVLLVQDGHSYGEPLCQCLCRCTFLSEHMVTVVQSRTKVRTPHDGLIVVVGTGPESMGLRSPAMLETSKDSLAGPSLAPGSFILPWLLGSSAGLLETSHGMRDD